MASTHTKSYPERSNFEVAEYMVRSLDGTDHRALFAIPGSGIVYQKNGWTIETADTGL